MTQFNTGQSLAHFEIGKALQYVTDLNYHIASSLSDHNDMLNNDVFM